MRLDLTPDELLSTTRAVRRRLDTSRPVEREVLEECLRLAQQAPTASFRQNWHFVVVTDAAKRTGLAELWREGARAYLERPELAAGGQLGRIGASLAELIEHIDEVPVHVIPCIEGHTDGEPARVQASKWASIVPAAWSFMLAAR